MVDIQQVLSGMRYGFYILSHPFDGFWRMKSEKRGNLKAGGVLLALFALTLIIRIYNTGYLMGGVSMNRFSIWVFLPIIFGLLFLYTVANWSLMTLLEGKGRIAEILTALAYATLPITLVNIPITVLSNFVSIEEIVVCRLLSNLMIVWAVFLLLVGNLSVHDCTMKKSIVSVLITGFFMLVIAVAGILFFNLLQKVYVLIVAIISEVVYRV